MLYIYRVATNEQPRKEYYIYKTWETVMQHNDIHRPPFENTIGVHMKPIVTLAQDGEGLVTREVVNGLIKFAQGRVPDFWLPGSTEMNRMVF